jgi:ATP-binding cassette subfamily C protein
MSQTKPGPDELRAMRRQGYGLFGVIFLFSLFVNLLMLTGPIFMLQVYDRVLSSRSEATLVALFALVAFFYLMMSILDHLRGRISARVGARFQAGLDRRVFEAALRVMARSPAEPRAQVAQRDLESVQKLLASPVFLALFDAPWTPVFLALIFIFHPLLGVLALAGGVLLVLVTLLNQWLLRRPLARSNDSAHRAERQAEQIKAESELIRSLGMQGAAFARWQVARSAALESGLASADRSGLFTSMTKGFRLFLQSAMLALGAWLVLENQITPGVMIAASIILGRALAPVELAVGQWALVQRAQEGWTRLGTLLAVVPPEPPRTPLPRPAAKLSAQGLSVVPPGESAPALRGVSFALEPGQALGVIGPSGAGKSSLARAVIGAWAPATGKVRLDGAALDQYDPDVLGRLVGYLPQRIVLFDGSIAENIARLDANPDPTAIVRAAQRAGAHDMITALPDGYDTQISTHGGRLSGGQVQRIGLARALYGDPVLVVLDEPNSNLDADGSAALNGAIRALKAEGAAVLIMAHRPAAIQECDLLIMLQAGAQTAFGPRDQVLREVVRNHTDIVRPAARPAATAPDAGAPS